MYDRLAKLAPPAPVAIAQAPGQLSSCSFEDRLQRLRACFCETSPLQCFKLTLHADTVNENGGAQHGHDDDGNPVKDENEDERPGLVMVVSIV